MQELFNLRHASARNIIERMFGILKNRFTILKHNPDLAPDIQACLPPALVAVHNIICDYDRDDLDDLLDDEEFADQNFDELDLQIMKESWQTVHQDGLKREMLMQGGMKWLKLCGSSIRQCSQVEEKYDITLTFTTD